MTRRDDLLAHAKDSFVGATSRVRLAEAELASALIAQAAAEDDVRYWSSVREPDEILRLCLVEGTAETIVHGQDIVRDGRDIRVCMEQQPCPVHGRPLGSSDWRLHPVRGQDVLDCGMLPSYDVPPGTITRGGIFPEPDLTVGGLDVGGEGVVGGSTL